MGRWSANSRKKGEARLGSEVDGSMEGSAGGG